MTRPKIGFFIIRPEVEKSQVITIFLKPISDLRNNDEAPSVGSYTQHHHHFAIPGLQQVPRCFKNHIAKGKKVVNLDFYRR